MEEKVTTDESAAQTKPLLAESSETTAETEIENKALEEEGLGEPDAPLKPLKEIRPSWSPYFAGFGLGVTLLLAYWFLGTGLGASGGLARFSAWIWHGIFPNHVERSAYGC